MPHCSATCCHTTMPHYNATGCHTMMPHWGASCCHLCFSLLPLCSEWSPTKWFACGSKLPLSDPTMLQISHLISVTGTTGGTPFTQYKIDFFLLQISGMLYLQKCFLLCDAVVGAVKTYCNVVLRCFLASLCYISWDAKYHATNYPSEVLPCCHAVSRCYIPC